MYMNKKELMILEELSCLKLSEQEQECMISDLEKMLIYMKLPRETAKEVTDDIKMELRNDNISSTDDSIEKGGENIWIPKML